MKFFGGVFDQPSYKNRLSEIEKILSAPDAWSNPEALTPILKEKSQLEADNLRFEKLHLCHTEMIDWFELVQEFLTTNESSPEFLEALTALEVQVKKFQDAMEETEMYLLLGSEEDKMDAILEIHPGAGGTEAQDWAEMLERMYLRWADLHGFSKEEMDYLPGDEAGIKSVTLRISGENVYGLLKGERGIHRLIRISPFDSSGRRHTSFASVDVIPDVGEEIVIDIKDSELRIDVFRSSGPGGQSVNTTSSAVRITHIPTGIVAQCQNEKSQHHNKESAMRILRARLYEQEIKLRDAAKQAQYMGKDAISFGSQIRTYTMQPYRLVKDHRTNCESSDVEAVLGGQIDKFINSYLLSTYRNNKL